MEEFQGLAKLSPATVILVFWTIKLSFKISTTDGCQITFSRVLLFLTIDTKALRTAAKISTRYLVWFRFSDQFNILPSDAKMFFYEKANLSSSIGKKTKFPIPPPPAFTYSTL